MQAVNPTDEKYRRLRLSNARIQTVVTDAPPTVNALIALGWLPDPEEADFLICPKNVRPSMGEVGQLWNIA